MASLSSLTTSTPEQLKKAFGPTDQDTLVDVFLLEGEVTAQR